MMAMRKDDLHDAHPGQELLRLAYDLELTTACPGLRERLKEAGAYEQAFEHWLDKQVEKVVKGEQ